MNRIDLMLALAKTIIGPSATLNWEVTVPNGVLYNFITETSRSKRVEASISILDVAGGPIVVDSTIPDLEIALRASGLTFQSEELLDFINTCMCIGFDHSRSPRTEANAYVIFVRAITGDDMTQRWVQLQEWRFDATWQLTVTNIGDPVKAELRK